MSIKLLVVAIAGANVPILRPLLVRDHFWALRLKLPFSEGCAVQWAEISRSRAGADLRLIKRDEELRDNEHGWASILGSYNNKIRLTQEPDA